MHEHDRGGGHKDHEIIVGPELVKYRTYRCSCGAVVENKVLKRTKINN